MRVRFGRGLARHHHIQAGLQKRQQRSELLSQAALDPVAEHRIYQQFNNFVEGKTAIYISHRLSSCRFCDTIAVFRKGELVQCGTHDALLKETDGEYKQLWDAQAKYYLPPKETVNL